MEEKGNRMSFEEALKRLEEIVQQLERGELGLEESLRLYEEGEALVRYCTQLLQNAELRIRNLQGEEIKTPSPQPEGGGEGEGP